LQKAPAKSLVVRELCLIGRLDEDLHEAMTLRFGDREICVVAQ
jgi:hypothetical protein